MAGTAAAAGGPIRDSASMMVWRCMRRPSSSRRSVFLSLSNCTKTGTTASAFLDTFHRHFAVARRTSELRSCSAVVNFLTAAAAVSPKPERMRVALRLDAPVSGEPSGRSRRNGWRVLPQGGLVARVRSLQLLGADPNRILMGLAQLGTCGQRHFPNDFTFVRGVREQQRRNNVTIVFVARTTALRRRQCELLPPGCRRAY